MPKTIKIKNTSGHKVDISGVIKKLIPFTNTIKEDAYPLTVEIVHKKNEMDHSHYDIDKRLILLKVKCLLQTFFLYNKQQQHY